MKKAKKKTNKVVKVDQRAGNGVFRFKSSFKVIPNTSKVLDMHINYKDYPAHYTTEDWTLESITLLFRLNEPYIQNNTSPKACLDIRYYWTTTNKNLCTPILWSTDPIDPDNLSESSFLTLPSSSGFSLLADFVASERHNVFVDALIDDLETCRILWGMYTNGKPPISSMSQSLVDDWSYINLRLLRAWGSKYKMSKQMTRIVDYIARRSAYESYSQNFWKESESCNSNKAIYNI